MLNSELVEKFHSVFHQKMTGSLTVAGDDFNVRFLFQEGEVASRGPRGTRSTSSPTS